MFLNIDKYFERFLLPLAESATNQPTLAAIRSALVVTLPLVLLGSIAELFSSFPLPAYRDFMLNLFGPEWRSLSVYLRNGTFSVMSLIMLFSIGQNLTEQHNAKKPIHQVSPVIAALVCFSSFLCLIPTAEGMLSQRWIGVSSLFVATVVAVVAARIFFFLNSFKRLRLYLPGGTTDFAIPQAFNSLLPGMFTVLGFATLGTLVHFLTGISLPELVHVLIRAPFDLVANGLQRGMLYILSLQSLWFFGIHGANVLDPITHDIYGAAMEANVAAAAAGQPLPNIMTKVFMDTFVFMGGSGTSLCLVGALLLFGKSMANRKLGAISIIPGIFNINEIILFGLPVVLNPIMFIPFVCTPLLLAGISYVAVASGLVPGTSVTAEWTTPIFLNGYLCTGSFKGAFLQLFNLIVGILTYAPFVRLSNKIHEKSVESAFDRLMQRACSSSVGPQGKRCLDYMDDAGSLARGLLADLENACQSKDGLHLVYQPQISAHDGCVVGVEALMRWQHPHHGWIPAPITIALAEDSGLIKPLGLWAFETACQARRDWLDQGVENLSISVNVSAMQLNKNLLPEFLAILKKYNLPPRMIEIEVTESAALDAGTPESHVLGDIYAAGLPIAIDDFGMGHSSLKYLKQFPVSEVKIDGAITTEVITNPICADIVASITRLCQARNIVSVAEFVDNDEQAVLLRSLGCDIFQGYKYSKPLPTRECLDFIKRTNASALKDCTWKSPTT